jgi:hypothetical protein
MTCLRPLVSLSLLFATFTIGPGCGLGACDEVGCVDGLSINATIEGASDGAVVVRLYDDGELVTTFDCPTAGEACTPDGAEGDTRIDRTAVGELSIWGANGGDTLRVEADLEGQTYAAELQPQWEETQPNGLGCPPTCRVAPEADVTLVAQ